jgi:Asp-tRNA(Asn)/Glu-tRNA(Gln) amidotransferase C subunit
MYGSITPQDVKTISETSNLNLTEVEIQKVIKQFNLVPTGIIENEGWEIIVENIIFDHCVMTKNEEV